MGSEKLAAVCRRSFSVGAYMKSLIFSCLLLMGTSALQASKEQNNADIRDLIILLDTHVETTIESGGFVLNDLITALHQHNAPVLVSAPLWKIFVEGKQEYKGQCAIPNTNDATLATLVRDINTRINYWYQFLSEHNKDSVHTKMLTIERINTEFYTKEAYKKLQDEKRVVKQQAANETFLAYSRCAHTFFNPDEWYSSIVDNAYYLLIPKAYAEKYTSSTDFYEVIETLFAPPAPLDRCDDPLNIAWLLHAELNITSDTIIPALTKIFTASTTTQKRPLWCIYMCGHGVSQSVFQNSSIAGMTWEAYQNVCSFFDEYVSMHSLWIASCQAGGHNRLAVFDDESQQYRYQYPIIIESLSDTVVLTSWLSTPLPDGESVLTATNISWNAQAQQWHLNSELGNNFKKFFKHLHQLSVQKNDAEKLFSHNDIFEVAQKLRVTLNIANTPQLFLPGTDTSSLCYPDCAHRIDAHSVILAQLCNQPIEVSKKYLFIDVASITQPVHITNTIPDYVISTTPGNMSHYFAALDAPKVDLDSVICSFWQLRGSACNKLFLIDTITCMADPKNPLAQAIGVTEESLTVTNVMIDVIKNEQIRVVFTNSAGATFSAQMRKLSSDTEPVLRNVQLLSADSADAFTAWYQKEKTECVDNPQVAYTKLYDLYAKDLNVQCAMQKSTSDDDASGVADADILAKNPETRTIPTNVQLV
jgi:hypothetical protein